MGGRYVLQAFLGKGAMGEVWRARHRTLGTPAAIKLVASSGDHETVARLLMEARSAASIVSPNVVRIFDHGQDAGCAYIAMELLEGETLAARLKRAKKLSPHATVLVTRDIAQGILVAHRAGIIHRDLKPENVFLAKTDQGEVAKVLDFGIAKSLTAPGMMTQANIVVGTPAYLSREQVMGGTPIDEQADLWSLGILVYECLTGRLPYAAATMAELFVQIVGGTAREMAARASDLPHGFGPWFLRATNPDPKQRFADARELAETLARVLAPDLSIVPWEVGSVVRPAVSQGPNRGVYIAAAMAVLALGLTGLAVREGLRSRAAASDSSAAMAPSPPTADAEKPASSRAEATSEAARAESVPLGADRSAAVTASPAEASAPVESAKASRQGSATSPSVASAAPSAPKTSAPGAPGSARRGKPGYNRWGL